MRTQQDGPKPRLLPPYGFVGPFVNGQPMGTGIILALPSAVAAGGSLTVAHNLGRTPTFVDVLKNGTPGFPGDAYISTANATTMTVVFQNAQTANTSFIYVT